MMKNQLLKSLVLAGLAGTLAAAQAQISDNVVRIGVLTDMSGPFSDSTGQGSVEAVRMAVEDFGGKVGNARVEVIFADHQNKADVGLAIANRWFDQEKVDAIFGMANSAIALAVNNLAAERGKAAIVTEAGTTDLTGKACKPTTIHWTYDTYSVVKGVVSNVVRDGGKSWFFLTADYTFGQNIEQEAARFVRAGGGEVVGSVRHPLNTQDFSSYLVQAQSSPATVIAMANAGADLSNALKQAAEFGVARQNKRMVAMLTTIYEIRSIGLKSAQGLYVTTPFYWDRNDESRAFAKRHTPRNRNLYPDLASAGNYAATQHYLKAVDAAKTDAGVAVVQKMKELPTDSTLFGKGSIRRDGRKIHPMFLYRVKAPSESKGEWDLLEYKGEVPGDQAFRPESEGGCSLVAK